MQRILVKQADGHPTVAFRESIDEKHSRMVPNGTVLQMVGRDGEHVKVMFDGRVGYIKARNAKLIVSAKKPPAQAPVAKPVSPKAFNPPTPDVVPAKLSSVCTFSFNGTPYTIDTSKTTMEPDMSVHDWIVANVPNSGLRRSCGVGRCGSCVSMLTFTDANGKTAHRSFNSCLRPILACNGMHVTSSIGIGTTKNPHAVQKAIAENNGTQCGFCSVGMVMNLYSHLQESPQGLTTSELDKLIDSNYCRCTGYRPILAAYKSFATNASDAPKEDAAETKRRADIFSAEHLPCPPAQPVKMINPAPANVRGNVRGTVGNAQWVQATTEAELMSALKAMSQASPPVDDIFLVGGHTSVPLFPRRANAYIQVGTIPTLQQCSIDDKGVTLGASTTLNDAVTFLEQVASTQPADKVISIKKIAEHGVLSPGGNIRNAGTLGGNVMIAYEHQNNQAFPVDWPMLFQAVRALVTVVDATNGSQMVITLDEFFNTASMKYKYIQKFFIPYSNANDVFFSFRTASRQRYAEADCAAAMRCNISGGKITKNSVALVFNSVGPKPMRYPAIEAAMNEIDPTNQALFQSLCEQLANSISPIERPDYKRSLALSYFYKFFLNMQPSLPSSLILAAHPWLLKNTTQGTQHFQKNTSRAPVGEPIPKIDGLKQCTGEAEYVQNIPLPANTLHACPVTATTIGNFTVSDAEVAAKVEGYKGMILAKDVPNNKHNGGGNVIAENKTTHIGEVVCVMLADTPQRAVLAAKAVEVVYTTEKGNLILTCEDAIAAGSYFTKKEFSLKKGNVATGFNNSDYVVDDTWDISGQYHFHMETQSCLALPNTDNDGLEVHSATQLPVALSDLLCETLEKTKAQVIVKNKRCGGGFGGKLFNSVLPAKLTSVAALTKKQPVSMVLEQNTNMQMLGLRVPWHFESKVGFNKDGTINAVQLRPYANAGFLNQSNGSASAFLVSFDNCYNVENWDVDIKLCKTDLPSNTSMRGPGWLPGIYNSERVISVVAAKLGMSAADVREKNFYKKGDVTPYGFTLSNWDIDSLWANTKQSSGWQTRMQTVQTFNKTNRWVKKGLALVPTKFAVGYTTENAFDVDVAVNNDGSVSVMSGGTEIGQGLTTKVTQTIAFYLGIPMDRITIIEQSTAVLGKHLGEDITGGSISSELCSLAAKNACNRILEALSPVKKLLPNASWDELVKEAYRIGIPLHFLAMDEGIAKGKDANGDVYNTYGVCALECTLDVLTGQVDLPRSDLIFDIGTSANPAIDIGQVEGAFVMGLGYTLTESISYDDKGAMKCAEYLLPTPWEIPTTFNVTLATEIANPVTVNGGKAIGEPPMTFTYAAIDAVQMATAAAAADAKMDPQLCVSSPFTVEQRYQLAKASYKNFTLS
eukprot:TRINITY_DN15530_c0_g2_i1.p1 TRINITY_DN15530_c0_g2~~TRINITY_DN15530_c0_g2_i1.p1  ORF type:complete len:1380 (+),score=418.54 TRINITY_DN15530_c0_g2_i1:45-4184(+)